jgi:hypothetical protein
MPQKSKAAAKSAKGAVVKSVKKKTGKTPASAKTKVKSVKSIKAAPAGKLKVKLAEKPSPPAEKKASPTVKPGKKAETAPAKAETGKPQAEQRQIAKAKAALRKESSATTNSSVGTAPAAATKSKGKRISVDINPNEAASALSAKWITLYKKSEQIEAKPYNMKAVFEEKTAIMHKVLGWGYILANRNDRLEVLFKDGIKYLISNYKP